MTDLAEPAIARHVVRQVREHDPHWSAVRWAWICWRCGQLWEDYPADLSGCT